MLYRALALSLFVTLTFSSCADEQEAISTSGAHTVPMENLAESQKWAKNGALECGANCSPSVGLLTYANDKTAGQCSAFLVSPDTIATNSHCIPEDLKEPGTPCKDRIWIHFAENGSQETRIACDKVIYDSKNYKGIADLPDYAFVKLATNSTRPALRISRDGFADGSMVSIQKVNPIKKQPVAKGRQQLVQCRTVQNSSLLDSFFHKLAPTALVTECLIVDGNSGSPVLANDGTVRGVVFAVRNLDDVKQVFAQNKNLKLKESPVSLNSVANFACLREIDGSEGNLAPACISHSVNLRQHLAKQGRDQTAMATAAVEKQMAAMRIAADFKWTSRFEKAGLKISLAYADVIARPVPTCVKAAAAARYANGVDLNLPRWEVVEIYDRYLRGETTLGTPVYAKTTVKLFAAGSDKFTALISGQNFVYKAENIPICQ